MKYLRIMLVFALCAAAAVCPAAGAEGEGKAPAQLLIEKIVVTYAATGERAAEALEELAGLDPELGDRWARVMDLWEAPVTVYDEIPDGLPEDDSLCLVALGFQLDPDGTMREELLQRLGAVLRAAQK